MDFIKRISHSLFFATGAGARKLRWIAVCTLLAMAAAGLAQFNHLWPRRAQAEPAAALQGEAALRRLKTDGGYASLAAALAAARYQIYTAPAKSTQSGASFYANNPGQQLRATFARDEVRVSAASNKLGKLGGKTDGAELRLRLTGFGYGDQLEPLAAGILTAHGDRIEIKKAAICNPQSAITEWYVNKPEGLEQGFTLDALPAPRKAGEWLRVALTIGDGWRAGVRGDGQGALFERQSDGLRLGYDHLVASDAQGRTLPARMALEGGALALLVDDAQAVYPVTIDPILTQQQKLTATDGAADGRFGAAVALSGNTAVIGAPRDDVTGGDQGSAYVFTRNGAVWTQQQRLTASDGMAGDQFGISAALSGDTLVVGAANDDIGANENQGSAYVFIRNGTDWTQQQKLTANDGAAGDVFGFSVALSGETVVVGASNDDIGPNADQGSAYVFTRSFTNGGAAWMQQQKLIANDGAASDFFGLSVALSGDTAVVGAFEDDISLNQDQGSAYVFTRNGAAWTQQQKLIAADGAAGDFFGLSVALSGDTVVVGAFRDAIGANAVQGSAYVFTRSGAVWTQQQKLTASDGAAGDFFGRSVALSGDTVVVGASNDDIGANGNQGSAYVFSRSGATWTQQRKLTADDGAAFDSFGLSVALSGDTVVVGVQFDDIDENRDQGSAYVFVICANNLVQQQQLTANDGAAGDNFGFSVAISGDTVVVGAPFDSVGPTRAAWGSVYVFIRSGTVWTLQSQLYAALDGATGDLFGISVAISGDTVVVGAANDDIGANVNQGSAYVFTRSNANWRGLQKLTANDGAAGDQFGLSVAISGDTLVVGAGGDTIGANLAQGSAYVFTRSGPDWRQQQKLSASDGVAVAGFGNSVALNGDTVVVGAAGDVIGRNGRQGSIYIFTGAGGDWKLQQKLIAAADTAVVGFGFSVALYADTVVVGVLDDNTFTPGSQGSAYVFTRIGAAWTQQQKLIANDGAVHNYFSTSVAISGDTLVVGAFFDTVGANANQGSAYVFTRDGAVWTQQQRLTVSDGAAGDSFGIAVALSGDTVVVGANKDDIGANRDQGSAYVFVCPACPTVTLNPASLPNGVIGAAYSQIVTASAVGGGMESFQFSLSDGALPPGLTLAQNGQLTGTPTAAGAYRFTITATVLNSLCPGSRTYTLTVTQSAPIAIVSAASFIGNSLAPESIVAAFGSGLAKSTEAAATQPLPTTLAGTRVSVLDSLGTERAASLFFVSPTQINFQVPPGTAAGKALVTIIHDETVAAASPQIEMVSPGLFSANANGQGLMTGLALRVKADGSQSFEPVARFDEEKKQFVATPIELRPATDRVFLVMFATGLRNRSSLGSVSVNIGGVSTDALYAGPQGSFAGLDQLNVLLPRNLAGRGEADVAVTVDGKQANALKVTIK